MWQQAQLTTDKIAFSLSGKKQCSAPLGNAPETEST
jgi:hypothetical protein